MKKNVKIFLEHILEAINLIEEYIKDKEKSDFLESKQLQDSVIRRRYFNPSILRGGFRTYVGSY